MMTRDVPTPSYEASERFDIDERERASVEALSHASAGLGVELAYIQGRLDAIADELGVELLAISIHLGSTKLFVKAHEIDTWAVEASESSAALMLERRGDSETRGYRKLAVRSGDGRRLGSLHVLRRPGVEPSPIDLARLEMLGEELGALLGAV